MALPQCAGDTAEILRDDAAFVVIYAPLPLEWIARPAECDFMGWRPADDHMDDASWEAARAPHVDTDDALVFSEVGTARLLTCAVTTVCGEQGAHRVFRDWKQAAKTFVDLPLWQPCDDARLAAMQRPVRLRDPSTGMADLLEAHRVAHLARKRTRKNAECDDSM